MKHVLSAVSLALASVMAFAAQASELKPMEAGTFVLGSQSVSIYYTASGDIYEVVATVAPDGGGSGAPIRFVSFLEPGQKALISAGHFGSAAAPLALELVHDGDSLRATEVANVASAN
jgi:hypothetical protein